MQHRTEGQTSETQDDNLLQGPMRDAEESDDGETWGWRRY